MKGARNCTTGPVRECAVDRPARSEDLERRQPQMVVLVPDVHLLHPHCRRQVGSRGSVVTGGNPGERHERLDGVAMHRGSGPRHAGRPLRVHQDGHLQQCRPPRPAMVRPAAQIHQAHSCIRTKRGLPRSPWGGDAATFGSCSPLNGCEALSSPGLLAWRPAERLPGAPTCAFVWKQPPTPAPETSALPDPAAAVHAPDRLLGPEEHAVSKQLGSMVHTAVDVGSGSI
jgi:hypothetical protein